MSVTMQMDGTEQSVDIIDMNTKGESSKCPLCSGCVVGKREDLPSGV